VVQRADDWRTEGWSYNSRTHGGRWYGVDDPRVDRLAAHVVEQQMADGGWNCRAMPGYGGATHGSFHTTISALEGLLEYDRFRGRSVARAATARGREFLKWFLDKDFLATDERG